MLLPAVIGKKLKQAGSVLAPDSFADTRRDLDFLLPVRCLVDYPEHRTGALLLMSPRGEQGRLVFAWHCRGRPSFIGSEEAHESLARLSIGLKSFGAEARITVVTRFKSDAEGPLPEISDNLPLEFLLADIQKSRESLARIGQRQRQHSFLRISLPIGPSDPNQSIVSRWWQQFGDWLMEVEPRDQQQQYHKALLNQGQYARDFQLHLEKVAGLAIAPMGCDDLLELVANELDVPCPSLPSYLAVTSEKVKVHRVGDLSQPGHTLLSWMLGKETPSPFPSYIRSGPSHQPTYIAVLQLSRLPYQFNNALDAHLFLHKTLVASRVSGLQITCELEPGNTFMATVEQEQVLKKSKQRMVGASKHNLIDPVAEEAEQEAIESLHLIKNDGEIAFKVAFAVLLRSGTRSELERNYIALQQHIIAHGRGMQLSRETEAAWIPWLQSQTSSISQLGNIAGFFQGEVLLSHLMPSFLPLVTTPSPDKRGVELLSRDAGIALYIDLFSRSLRIVVFAKTGSGKSVLVAQMIVMALMYGQSVTVLDFPRADGQKTYSDFTPFLNGKYINPLRDGMNIFDLPDKPEDMQETVHQARLEQCLSTLEEILLHITTGGEPETRREEALLRTVIESAIRVFYETPDNIKNPGPAFLAVLQEESLASLDLETDAELREALLRFRRAWRKFTETPAGKTLLDGTARIESTPLVVAALTSIDNKADAALFGLAFYGLTERRALAAKFGSQLVIDEAPLLFGTPVIAERIARLCANGRALGITVIIIAQDPDSIARCDEASKILQNLDVRLIGAIEASAIPSYCKTFGYTPSLLQPNVQAEFKAKKDGASQWLLEMTTEEQHFQTVCRYYPGKVLLALVVNNPEEMEARQKFMREAENPYQGLCAYARSLSNRFSHQEHS